MLLASEAPASFTSLRAAPAARRLAGRVVQAVLPLVKLRTQLRGISLGVRAKVTDEADRVLLIRHSYLPGWHFPGGGVEFGETADEALRRELAEEAGVALQAPARLVGVYVNPSWTRGDHVLFFETSGWTPCRSSWGVEIEAVEFFPKDRLPPGTHPSVRRRLQELDGAPPAPHW